MIKPDIIRSLILYFMRFIPVKTRKSIFKQPSNSRLPAYEEWMAEVMAISEEQVIPELDSFMLSINEKYVSDRVKKSADHLLFVEYGNVDLVNPHGIVYNDIHLQISVATPFNESNNDMIMEAIRMQRVLEILNTILSDLQLQNEECGLTEFIQYPARMTPLAPELFFDHIGWAVSFPRRETVV